MDRTEFVDNRRALYLGHVLRAFEQGVPERFDGIESLLELSDDPELTETIDRFKRYVRREFQMFANDIISVLDLESNAQINPLAIEMKDRLARVPS